VTPQSAIAADEEVIVLSTIATPSADGDSWDVPLHVWIYEPEDASRVREALAAPLATLLGLDAKAAESPLFRERARMILADNEGGKSLVVTIGAERFALPATRGNGRSQTTVKLANELVEKARAASPAGGVLPVRVPTDDPTRFFEGRVYLTQRTTIAVISDIDDTIKVSEVADRSKLIANTFLHPFRAVDGIQARLRAWADEGACFFYCSMTPWQLAPALDAWLVADGFPGGELVLRDTRVGDGSVLSLFDSPDEAKPPMIDGVFERLPEATFVLLGDSGQSDPAIYASYARRFGGRVRLVAIRNTTNEPATHERWVTTFKDLPREQWLVFNDASELPASLRGGNAPSVRSTTSESSNAR
jgi:hypothetical protein